MMIRPPKEILEYSKIFEPYLILVDGCGHGVLKPNAPNEAVEAFIKCFEYMTGKKPDVVKWSE